MKRADVIRRGGDDGTHWYGVCTNLRPQQEFDYVTLGITGEIARLRVPLCLPWSYANPNDKAHADISPEIWDLRRRVLAGEVG